MTPKGVVTQWCSLQSMYANIAPMIISKTIQYDFRDNNDLAATYFKFQWNFSRSSNIFIEEIHLKMSAKFCQFRLRRFRLSLNVLI